MSPQTEVLLDNGALRALRDFWQSDRLRVIHACKTAIAVAIGTGICMRLELARPRTTMVSIVIVMMHQQVGMTIARGIYRLLGMLAGCMVALFMVVYLSQSFAAFYVVLACWTACCVWGAFFYRNYQSYGFVLAGYATAIVAVPAWTDPYGIVDGVIYTISDVVIAVVTASAVNALIFPQSVGAAFFAAGQRHCSHLIGALRTVLAFSQTPSDLDALHFALNKERTEVEALRSAAVFEDPELRARTPMLREIGSEFLDVTTTLHAVKQIRTRAQMHHDATELASICRLSQEVMKSLPGVSDAGDLSLPDIARTETALNECLQACSDHDQASLSLPTDDGHRPSTLHETFARVLREAIEDLVLYLRLFVAIREPVTKGTNATLRLSSGARYVSTANRWAATAAAARALIVVAVVASAWYISGWDDGSTAVIGAAITSALFAVFPNPSMASRQLLIGALLGSLVASLFGFLVLPHLDGFLMLAAALAPIIMFGSYVGSFPSLGPTGISFNIYFSYVVNITNPGTYEPTALLDAGFAFCTGIGVAVLAFGVLLPPSSAWVTRFYVRQMRRMVSADACRSVIDHQSLRRFESGVRDYMVQVSAPSAPDLARQWGFAVLDVGSAVLKVRDASLAEAGILPSHWQVILNHWRESISLLFEAVTVERYGYALEATCQALRILSEMPEGPSLASRAWIDSLRAYVHFVKIELVNPASPLHPATPGEGTCDEG
ncbi:FUSC family protein [Dyella sp. Tek66A03]|uniref:FUSC family protein n=1 Tax=Dyella sp. Tek66A03 TaxID=3458298 RepID=UPI00403E7BF8